MTRRLLRTGGRALSVRRGVSVGHGQPSCIRPDIVWTVAHLASPEQSGRWVWIWDRLWQSNDDVSQAGRDATADRRYLEGMRRMPLMMVVVGGFLLFRLLNGNDGGLVLILAIGAVVVVGLLVYRAYVSRQTRRRSELIERADVGSLTEKVESMLGDTANTILEVEDRPALSESPEATEHFQKAVATFASVDDRLEAATTVGQLRLLVSELDDALWGLDAAQAALDGEAPPERTQTLPTPSPLPQRASIRESSSEAIARWMDGGSGRHHHRHRRSC